MIRSKTLVCPVCGNRFFTERAAQLNTAGMSFLDLDFLNKTAQCYVCSECTHFIWFLEKGVR